MKNAAGCRGFEVGTINHLAPVYRETDLALDRATA